MGKVKKIVFFINELNVRGGTHKQLLKFLDYVNSKNINIYILTYHFEKEITYPGYSKYIESVVLLKKSKTRIITHRIFNWIHNAKIIMKVQKNAQIINIHDNGFDDYLPLFLHKKVIWQINDLPYYYSLGNQSNKQKKNWHDYIRIIRMYVFVRIVNVITVNVTKNKERVYKVLGKKSEVLYCGIDKVNIDKDVNNSIRNFESNKINLLSSGVFFNYRNYETVINVTELLLKRGIDTYLNIFGKELDVNYTNKIKSIIRNKKLENNIKIWGEIDEKLYNDLHKESDFYVFVNIDQSWGLAVFEAMSCGIPTIVSNSVGAVEILTDNFNSIIVNPIDEFEISDKIINIFNDRVKYKEISYRSKMFCDDFSWDKSYSEKLYSIMEKMIC